MSKTIQGFRLSLQQERLWTLSLAAPEPFRARVTISLEGVVDPPALRAALRRVVARHEILRTRFSLLPGMSLPLQVVTAETSLVWREGEEETPASTPAGDSGAPEREPVVHARLERRSSDLHRLHLELPALCADAQTLVNLAREIGLHYDVCRRSSGAALGEPVQYADFAGWQREAAVTLDEAARKLWQIPGLAEALRARLPGGSGAAAGARFLPRTVRFPLPMPAVERLVAGGGDCPAQTPAVLLAAWIFLLQRHLETSRVMVGVAVTGRAFEELAEAFGLYSRYLPCAEGVLETASLAVAAAELAGHLGELSGRQESFSWEGLDIPAEVPRFFPFGFEWREVPPAWQVDGVRFSLDEIGVLVDRFVAKLTCVRRGAGLVEAELLYDAAVIPAEQAELLAARFTALLRDAGERPGAPAGELGYLSEDERRQILAINRTDADLGGELTLAALFETQQRRSPSSAALVLAGETLTYGELEAQANRLARLLRRLGVGPEVRVALHVERSFDLMIALLAIAKAGGAYVPIDPGYPRELQNFMLADCGASLLLVRDGEGPHGGGLRVLRLQERPAAAERPEPLPPAALPANLAYVLYTSGSTGRPKGVMVSHAAIANRLLWMQRDFPLTGSDRILQKTPYGFDASIWEIFVPLLAGAQVVLAEPGGHRDSRYLLDAVVRHDITVLQLVPSQLAAFVDEEGVEECRSLRGMFCGGEALSEAVAERLLGRTAAELCNLYGPTEAAIDASFHVCPRGEPLPGVVPIGLPLANVQLHLVDRLLRPVPPLLPGEILIGGAGLARGYLGRPELAAERFVPDPWGPPGGRLYRTGDLGSRGPGGVIEILGRIDDQVKLRGVRIELGEIEARLREHPAVRDAVVLVREEASGEPSLVGCVVRRAASPRADLCELPGGLRVACVNRNEAEVVYREIFTEGSYLRHGVELEDGASVLDVGANIGLFTLYLKQRFPASRVLAFEPIPAIFDKLRANVALHGLEVELFACALAEREGSARFTFYPGWSAMSGRYADAEGERSLTRTILSHDRLGASDIEDLMAGRFAGELVECPLKTLSQVLRENRVEWVDLLKIDVEKSELDVLRGIAEEDWSRIGQIVIELHDLDGRLETVRSLLSGVGFSVVVEQDAFLAGTPIFNLYCVRPGRRKAWVPRAASTEAAGAGAPVDDLRAFLSARLPKAMIPAWILEVDELPRLPNGKVDRKALAALAPEPERPERTVDPPRTPAEELLAEIWAGVLGRERVGVHESFFELGGHSLLATRLLSRVRAAFQVEVSLRRFFDDPTIAGLAALATEQEGARPAAPPIVPVRRDRELPLSFAQQRLWFIDKLQPGSASYNIAMPLRIEGRLAPALLGRALSEVVRRHEVLRTRFQTVQGRGVQVIDAARPVRLPWVDLSALSAPAGSAEALRLAGEDAGRPFDLGRDELLRITLLRLDAGGVDHAVLFTLHHIVSDGWSSGILVREVTALYDAFLAGRPSPLPELPIQYADFAVWQREWLCGDELEAQLSFWREQLAGAPQVLELPLDHPRPAVQTFRGASRRIALPPSLSAVVHELCRREGATPFMVLLAAWSALLGRLSGQEDVLVGTPIAGRNHRESEDLIGFFVNTLVMRADLSGAPGFVGLLGRVRRMALDAYAHQDLPFERLVEELAAGRDLARSPLFQTLFALQNAPVQSLSIEGLTLTPLKVRSGVAKFDLVLNLAESRETSFEGVLEYNVDLFDGSTIERLTARFEMLLTGVSREPVLATADLPLLLPAERQQLLVELNDTASAYPREACLSALFAAVAREVPDAAAVVSAAGEVWSYGRLSRAASGLARHLRSLGVGPETRVALCMERSPELIVSLLAVLKAGGAYAPLDAGYPDERLAFMLADTGAPLVLVDPRTRQRLEGLAPLVTVGEGLWNQVEDDPAGVPVPAESLALVIYTSGSTGRPKGVALTHRGVVRMVRETTYARWNGRDRVAHLANVSFDAATQEIWAALLHGATLVIFSREEALSPAQLSARIRRDGVTWMVLTTALFNQVAREQPEAFAPLCAVIFAGEAADPVAVARTLGGNAPGEILNGYGPAEGATISTWHRVRALLPGAVTVPIGRPVANTSVYVLDRRQGPVPPGVVGEILVGGDGLARGYLNRPDLTAERFIPHPWGSGERLYRTGDLVRQRGDGALEFLGRGDDQIKVRGFRIEPAEIEAALAGHPEISASVVLAREGAPGERRLVAYVVGEAGRSPGAMELRRHLQSRLPEFMIPAAFVALEALPLTPNGKLDQKALPAPERTETESYAAPSDPAEELLAGIWAEVLALDRVGVHDDFFALGGHSLLATQVASRIRHVLGVDLPLRHLFAAPTLGALARVVRTLQQERRGGPQAPPIVPLPRLPGGAFPLSFAQQRLWFLDRFEAGNAAYNLPSAVRLRGAISVPELSWIFARVAQRHEALRTTFGSREGLAVQVIAPFTDAARPALRVIDLSGLPETRRETATQVLADEEARRPFDLQRGPLLRLCLLRLAERDHVLLLTLHHIISDGWSTGVLLRELAALSASLAGERPATLPELPVQYADFAHWQRQWLHGEVLEAQLAYWRQQLAGAPRMLDLPLDRPRPPRRTLRGAVQSVVLPRPLATAVHGLCRQEGATPFIVLMAAWGLLLGRYSGQQDVLVGAPVAGRDRREVEDLIGFFVNSLVLRNDLSGSPSFAELVRRVRTAALDGYAHQDLPFERLVEELAVKRDLAVSPLFQAVLAFQNAPAEALSIAGLTLAPAGAHSGMVKFDLTLSLGEREGLGFAGALEYNTGLFDRGTIERLLGSFVTLLGGCLTDLRAPVWEAPLLGAEERRELLALGGPGEPCPVTGSLHSRFAAVAAERPDAVALVCEEMSLTYCGLDRWSNRLAHRLLEAGVEPGSRVCLAAERGLGLVAGIVGIFKAGCAYVPLDPSSPAERLAWTLADAGAAALVGEEAVLALLPAWPGPLLRLGRGGGPEEGPRVAAAPEWPAYVIYTSGSTGRPKGVVVSHGNVLRLLASTEERFGFGAEDVWTLFHSFAFDFSVWEIWGALLYGGRLAVVPYLRSRSPEATLKLVERETVTVLNQTPSAFQAFQHAEAERQEAGARSLRWVIFGGEALEPRSVEGWWRRRERLGTAAPGLVNMYGITETTVHVTWHLLSAAEVLGGSGSSIGEPLRDLQVYVLDPWGQPVPVGVAGELHVGGAGVSAGYLSRPELTAERFVPDGFGAAPGARLYRSGDLGRRRSSGQLEYLGRIDHQVKVRGFRIEPGEIESALLQQPGVDAAVVLVREDTPGDRRLVAYVVGAVSSIEELRRGLKTRLSEHMVPASFVTLPALPRTGNGKVDRRALPAPGGERPELGAEYVAPRSLVEEVLAAVWAEVLGLERIGIHDNFFALGGDSILSLRVVALARERGLAVELADLFQSQTVAELGAAVRFGGESTEEMRSEPMSLLSPEDRRALPEGIEDAYPLTLLQAGMLFHMSLAPDEPPYHNVDSWHLRARFVQPLFERAVERVVARHPVLRTSFQLTGHAEPLQLVHRQACLPVPAVDLTGFDRDRQEAVLGTFVAGEKRRLHDRTRPPQLRFHVHLRTADSFQLTLTENHAILDGWSLHSTLSEIFSGYFALLAGAELPDEEPPATSFRDFVRLERLALESAEQRQFWEERLRDCPATALPPGEGLALTGPRSRALDLTVPSAVTAGLKRLAQAAMVPLKSVLLAAHLKVMALASGQRELVTGLTSHGRPETPGGESVRGLFLNTLPFRFSLGGDTWGDLARDAFQAELEVFPYRRFPLAALQKQRGAPLFETVFNYIHFHVVEGLLRSGNVEVLGFKRAEGTNFSFLATFIHSPLTSDLQLGLEHDRSRLSDGQVRWGLGELYQRVLAAMAAGAAGSHEASLLAESERHQLLWEWNDPVSTEERGRPVHELFAEQAARTPDAAAVSEGAEAGGARLTYAELDRRASRLARRLRALGVGPEVLVGLCAERTVEMVVGILGILKAGGAYVPLDPSYPEERLRYLVADAGAPVVVAQAALLDRLPAGSYRRVVLEGAEAPEVPAGGEPLPVVRPENPAYVIYTSGSTGRPKGVVVTHRNVARLFAVTEPQIGFRPADVWTLFHSFAFDFSVWELWGALLYGGRVVIVPYPVSRSPEAFRELLVREGVTRLSQTPSAFRQLLRVVGGGELAVRSVVFGGEALEPRSLSPWFERMGEGARLVNMYGITEATVHVTYREISAAELDRLPGSAIGRPLGDLGLYLLDRRGEPIPLRVAGELYVGGEGLARGYLRRPELTAERFVPNPFAPVPGARLYRTGDLGRYLPGGELEYLGRIDAQVKIRGFRIELGEVEAALAAHPEVGEAVALVREDRPGDRRLVAYVAPRAGVLDMVSLRRFVRERMPEHMVPATFELLERMPLTAHGKIDRSALPAPSSARPETAVAFVPPRSLAERELARIWREVLGRDEVGIHDNFFELGGDSLRLFRAHLEVKEAFGRELPIADLFRFPTIGELARSLAGEGDETATEAVDEERATRCTTVRRSQSRTREQRRASRLATEEPE